MERAVRRLVDRMTAYRGGTKFAVVIRSSPGMDIHKIGPAYITHYQHHNTDLSAPTVETQELLAPVQLS
jgi:hypothetical protein